MRMRVVRAGGRGRGFTLIEVVAVVALIALAMTLAAVGASRGLSSARIQAAGQDLVAALRYTRGQAMVTRAEQVMEIDLENRTYTAPKRSAVTLPGDMEIRLLTAAQELTGNRQGRVRFFPDGSSTGGRIKLVDGQRAWDIEISWLTGEIRLREGRP
jgi:general secretion pathway protein H